MVSTLNAEYETLFGDDLIVRVPIEREAAPRKSAAYFGLLSGPPLREAPGQLTDACLDRLVKAKQLLAKADIGGLMELGSVYSLIPKEHQSSLEAVITRPPQALHTEEMLSVTQEMPVAVPRSYDRPPPPRVWEDNFLADAAGGRLHRFDFEALRNRKIADLGAIRSGLEHVLGEIAEYIDDLYRKRLG
jgi:hypothetical protein